MPYVKTGKWKYSVKCGAMNRVFIVDAGISGNCIDLLEMSFRNVQYNELYSFECLRQSFTNSDGHPRHHREMTLWELKGWRVPKK